MASITSLGTGSGLELESLVTKLMTAESVSLTTLQKKQTAYETKISAMGSLRSVLASLQTASSALTPNILQSAGEKYAAYTATMADTNVATATASTGAVAGKYSLEVSSLASSQRLVSAAQTSSSSKITTDGGTITLDLGTLKDGVYTADSGRSYSLTLSAGATLADLRDAINKSDAGVTATIITGDAGAQLVLTGKEGTNNVMRLSSDDITGFSFDPGSNGTQEMSETKSATDAVIKLNGITATSHSNSITSALDGVTIDLLASNSGSTTTLTITKDYTSNITSALQSFVSAFNTAYSKMSSLGAYDPSTQVAGDLQGNSTLRLAMSQIRQNIFNISSGNTSSTYQTLSNIGVSINASGALSIDTTKLTTAINADPTTVATLISNVGTSYDKTVEGLIGTTGSITVATSGLNKTVTDLEKQQDKMKDRLDAIETRYRSQFSALDTLVSSLTSTGDYLTSFLSSLKSSN